MTTYACNPVINITLMLLIVIGGIGFVTWEDIENNKYHFKRYKMQSKLIIVTTAVLITVPAIIFMINDMMTGNEKMPVFKALFQSVTLRTAGFNTVDLNAMKQAWFTRFNSRWYENNYICSSYGKHGCNI